MKNIAEMNREELLVLNPKDVDRFLTADEVVHIAKELGAFWTYDYEAAAQGRPGMHAELKSKLHSDGFFVSRILLEPENIRKIIARQMVMRLQETGALKYGVDYVVGVPDGATLLGEEIAGMIGVRVAEMAKIDNRITLVTPVEDEPQKTVLVVEDFCTKGTGFSEAVAEIRNKSPNAYIFPYNLVIINRGGVKTISVCEIPYWVLPVVEKRIQDWDHAECPLCKNGSVPIKPKTTDENWRALLTSQISPHIKALFP